MAAQLDWAAYSDAQDGSFPLCLVCWAHESLSTVLCIGHMQERIPSRYYDVWGMRDAYDSARGRGWGPTATARGYCNAPVALNCTVLSAARDELEAAWRALQRVTWPEYLLHGNEFVEG